MRVIYRDNILQQLDKVVESAINSGKVIEAFCLDDEEFDEYKYFRGFGLYEEYRGIPIKFLKEND